MCVQSLALAKRRRVLAGDANRMSRGLVAFAPGAEVTARELRSVGNLAVYPPVRATHPSSEIRNSLLFRLQLHLPMSLAASREKTPKLVALVPLLPILNQMQH